jgi:hypothetical protein
VNDPEICSAFESLIRVLAQRLDMNRRLARPMRRRRSPAEAMSEAASRWRFDYGDDEASW